MQRIRPCLIASLVLASTSLTLLAASPVAAQTAANPVAPTQGYLVFIEQGARLGAGDIEGTIAMGGQLQIGGQFTLAPRSSGSPLPTSLYVKQQIDFAGSTPGGRLNVNQSFARIGSIANAAMFGGSPAGNLRIVPSGGNQDTTPQINVNASQPQSSVSPLPQPEIDFASAFSTMRATSTSIAACGVSGVTLTDANGTTVYDPNNIPSGVQVYIHLTNNQTNVLNLTVANLLRVGSFTFRDQPSASRPFVVNVDVASTPSFTWAVQNQAGSGSNTAPFTLWNFVGTSTITLQGGDSLNGTFFGPDITLLDSSPNNIQGNVVAHMYDQGAGNTQGGEVHDFPFQPTISGCTAPPPVLGELVVKKSITGAGVGSQGPITLEIHCTPPNTSIPNFVIPEGATGTVTTIVTGITVPAVCEAVEVEASPRQGALVGAAGGVHSAQTPVCPPTVQGAGRLRSSPVPSIFVENVIDTTSTSSTSTTSTTTSSTTTTTSSTTTTTAESTTTTTTAGTTTTTAAGTTTTTAGTTTVPTTVAPTTVTPTTVTPTSVAPTTLAPTSVVPTTVPPVSTTAEPCVLPTTVVPTDELPATGSGSAPLSGLIAVAFAAAGLALVVVSRRRLV